MARILTLAVSVAMEPGQVPSFRKIVVGIGSHRSIWLPFLAGVAIGLILDRLLRPAFPGYWLPWFDELIELVRRCHA